MGIPLATISVNSSSLYDSRYGTLQAKQKCKIGLTGQTRRRRFRDGEIQDSTPLVADKHGLQ